MKRKRKLPATVMMNNREASVINHPLESPVGISDPSPRMQGKRTAFWRWAAAEVFKLADENPGEAKRFVIAMPGELRYYEIKLVEVDTMKRKG